MRRGFCERNLKPVFALLVLLVAATVVWAVVAGETKPDRAASCGLRRGTGRAQRKGDVGGGTDAAHRRHGGPGASATPTNRTAGRQPTAGTPMNGAKATVDAISMATPNGGINLITQPGTGSPSVGLGTPVAPARMQLLGAGTPSAPAVGGRHVFNTVSSLILPSVVGIHAAPRHPTANPDDPWHSPNQGNAWGRRGADVNARAYQSVGSGFIIDSRGYLLTNHHVISQAADLLVSVFGKVNRDLPATVVAADPTADLALVRISGAGKYPEVRLGDSRSAQVGDWVLAFGSPFGLEQTVTQGIISSKRESLVVGGVPYGDMLQTDVPINLGSSGGPLVDLKAEVIGINTAIYGPGGAFSGTGFVIPVDRVKAFLARCSHVFDR